MSRLDELIELEYDSIKIVLNEKWHRIEFNLQALQTMHDDALVELQAWCRQTFGTEFGWHPNNALIFGNWFYPKFRYCQYIFFEHEADASMFLIKYGDIASLSKGDMI